MCSSDLAGVIAAYARRIVDNAKTLAEALLARGYRLVTGGTDNHLLLMDLRGAELTGAEAAERLDAAGIVANKNGVPFDPRPPRVTSGIRLGTAALTTRGMGTGEMETIAAMIDRVLTGGGEAEDLARVRDEVTELCGRFPVFQTPC